MSHAAAEEPRSERCRYPLCTQSRAFLVLPLGNRHPEQIFPDHNPTKRSRRLTGPFVSGLNRKSIKNVFQAMLYATDGIEKDEDLQKPMVGVASVW